MQKVNLIFVFWGALLVIIIIFALLTALALNLI